MVTPEAQLITFGVRQSAVQQRALRVLKQKKLYEGQIGQLQQQTFNMEQASLTTENLRNTMATVDAMKTANKELKKQYGKLDVDKIEVDSRVQHVWWRPKADALPFSRYFKQMHYEMEDLIEQANEVQESMSRTYGVPDEVDEADLEAGGLLSFHQGPATGLTRCSHITRSRRLPLSQNLMRWAMISRKRRVSHPTFEKTQRLNCQILSTNHQWQNK